MSELSRHELAGVLEIVATWLKSSPNAQLRIGPDYYWSVAREAKYDVDKIPSNESLTIGQLTEDCETLKKLLTAEHDFIPADLVAVASLLSAMSGL